MHKCMLLDKLITHVEIYCDPSLSQMLKKHWIVSCSHVTKNYGLMLEIETIGHLVNKGSITDLQ